MPLCRSPDRQDSGRRRIHGWQLAGGVQAAGDPVTQFFAHLEIGQAFRLHLHGCTGTWIPPLAGAVVPGFETPEASDFNALIPGQCLEQTIEDGVEQQPSAAFG